MAEEEDEEVLDADIPYGADPLTPEERASLIATKATKGDWGPVFVYGSMLFPTAWSALTGYMPEMRSCTARGYERRAFSTGGFAGIFEKEGASAVGMLVSGLLPHDRLLLDAVVDDSFELQNLLVEPTGDAEARLMVSQCGLKAFNGRYLPDGTMEGRVCYRSEKPDKDDKHKTIHFEDGQWHIGVDYKGFWYKSDWDGWKPPPDGWACDADGEIPLPMIKPEPMTIECTAYVVRERCMDAMLDEDWDFEAFGERHLQGFEALCRDVRVVKKDEGCTDEELKELAMQRRRRQTGFEGGGGRRENEIDESDPSWIDPRLEVDFLTGIIRLTAIVDESHLQDPSFAQPVHEASEATGRTPAEEKERLESVEKATLGKRRKKFGQRYPEVVGPKGAGNFLQAMREGSLSTHMDFPEPLVRSGLPATKGTDFCVVSVPFTRFDWYTRACVICANFRIGLAVVSDVFHEDCWLYVWKQNVDKMVSQNKTLVVLTQVEMYGGTEDKPGIGRVDFNQSVQILYLQQKGYPFVVIDILHFCEDLQPLLSAGRRGDFDTVEQCLMERRSIVVPIVNVFDERGQSVMHYVARFGCSERAVRMLKDHGENFDALQWRCDGYCPGWTPLMHAAKYGPPRLVRLLAEANADFHIRSVSGHTAMSLAQGRPQNERMISQCHWRCCLTCTKDENDKPPENALEAKVITPEQHASTCRICQRFI